MVSGQLFLVLPLHRCVFVASLHQRRRVPSDVASALNPYNALVALIPLNLLRSPCATSGLSASQSLRLSVPRLSFGNL